jgi:diketogulonate reductase-like aldo/keto reductase
MERFVTSCAGVRMPGILYGTAWKKDETERLVRTAIQEGFRGIDTACQPRHYHEPGVGAGVAACLLAPHATAGGLSRQDLYLQTKFTPLSGQDPARIPYDPEAPLPQQVRQSCTASLENLRTHYLDCLLLHSPLPTMRQTREAWQAMESLLAERRVRQLGVSNCRLEELQTLCASATHAPAVVQNRFHADSAYDREIRAFCRERGMIYQSFWTLTANPHILAHRTLSGLAAKHRRTPSQILFRYLTQIDVVPLTGTCSQAHMREDLSIFEFELDADEQQAIAALF